MSRSSIFSFDTLRLSSVPRAWTYSAIATVALFGLAELGARTLMAPVGERAWTYWDDKAANKFETYRQRALDGSAPEVLAIGDSTAAYNFVPASFSETSEVTDVYNLAWPANFPLSFQQTTLPILREGAAPRYVILIQAATSFIDQEDMRIEAGILSSVLAKRQRGDFLVADYLHLSRLYPARRLLSKHWLRGETELLDPPPAQGYMSLGPGQPLTDTERQARIDGEAAHGETLNAKLDRRGFSEEKRASVTRLADLAKERGFQLIVVLSPLRSRPMPDVFVEHRAWLRELQEDKGFLLWDMLDTPEIAFDDYSDGIHLLEPAAVVFSRKLGERFHNTLR